MHNRKRSSRIANSLCLLAVALLLWSFSGTDRFVEDFRLINIDGRYVSLKDFSHAKGFMVVFTCNHCPFAKLYRTRMNVLNSEFKPQGVPLIAISSADTLQYKQDGFDKMREAAKEGAFNFPYLFDMDQSVAKKFGAKRTPEAFVIWKENGKWVIRYSGAIDDNGAEPEKVQHSYVKDAVEALLKGAPVKVAYAKSVGCAIKYK
jgi:peroxiredoxin